MCACMYFEVLTITTDIHCHAHRSYVSCWFVVRLLFVCIFAEMHCFVRLVLTDSLICCVNLFRVRLVLTDSLICCVNLFRVIVIGRSLPANVVSLASYGGYQCLPAIVVCMAGLT